MKGYGVILTVVVFKFRKGGCTEAETLSLCIPAKDLTQADSLGFVEGFAKPKFVVSACIAKA
jgi:hypothetical protein